MLQDSQSTKNAPRAARRRGRAAGLGVEIHAPAPGRHRVRVHTRGRDVAARGCVVETSSEEYLLQVWPEPDAS